MRTRPRTLIFTLAGVAAGLGGSAHGDPPVRGGHSCSVTVTGAATASWKAGAEPSKPASNAGSDYFSTDEELRSGLENMAGLFGANSPAEKKKKADELMKQDPRVQALIMNCMDGENVTVAKRMLSLTSNKLKYKDVPFKPASYSVGPEAKPGRPPVFGGYVMVDDTMYNFVDGQLQITGFDARGVTGTLTATAKSSQKGTVQVKSTFDFPCTGRSLCKP